MGLRSPILHGLARVGSFRVRFAGQHLFLAFFGIEQLLRLVGCHLTGSGIGHLLLAGFLILLSLRLFGLLLFFLLVLLLLILFGLLPLLFFFFLLLGFLVLLILVLLILLLLRLILLPRFLFLVLF